MTGFLARMAARATGGSSGATPQVPARFSVAPALETPPAAAEEPTGSASAPSRREHAVPSTAEAPAAPAALPDGGDRAERDAPGTGAPEPVRHRPAHVEPPAAAARPPAELLQPAPAARSAVVYGARSGPVVPSQPVPAAAVPVLENVERRAPSSSPAAAAAHAARRAPDVVHVSIGRIEVRAPAAPAAPVSRPARPSAPEPLGLDAYLRGQREAR